MKLIAKRNIAVAQKPKAVRTLLKEFHFASKGQA